MKMNNPCKDVPDRGRAPRNAWKLFRLKKDGSITPLFIGKTQSLPIGEWMEAEDIPTKGFAHRPGWHATLKPLAPHLKEDAKGSKRIWLEVVIEDFSTFNRPQSQGGTWVLAKRMMIQPLQPAFLMKLPDISNEELNRYNTLIKSAFG
jgi:hypothetical protein